MAIDAVTFISKDVSYTIANSDVVIFGNRGNETINITDNITGIIAGSNIENMSLSGNFSDYQSVVSTGNGFQLRDSSDTPIITLASLNVTMSVKFADQTLELLQTGATSFSLGGQTVQTAIDTTPSSSNVILDMSKDQGTSIDAGDNTITTYVVNEGSYSYTIDGFGSGDVLDIFDNAAFNVVSDVDETDGIQQVKITSANAQTVTLTLTGLSATEDEGLFNQASFNAVFGTGVII